MKGTLALLISIVVAVICWGGYGPVLDAGRTDMGGSSLRPFICVGLAYFLIAVLAPGILLQMTGEKGRWSPSGIVWSLIAGAAGAIGALGVILAFKFGGRPIYVMPLVFGGAPVVNTFLTMFLARSYRQAGPIFFAGLILVIAGGIIVLVSRPSHAPPKPAAAAPQAAPEAKPGALAGLETSALALLFTAMTALAWGFYGPTLHKGQMAMEGSRLRPFICVGLAYFVIAVVVPMMLLRTEPDGHFTWTGSIWSLAGGAAGALGALGIIMAFNFGGRPIFVMPIVFGGAPVVNTFIAVSRTGGFGEIGPVFYAGLIAVIAGAVTVLLFAPKAHPLAPAATPAPKTAAGAKA